MHNYSESEVGLMPDANDERAEEFARLADLIVDIAREVRLRSRVDAPGVPLNQTHSQVMRFVHEHPGALAADIAREAGIKPTNVSASVQALKGLGYLDARRDERDARSSRLYPTALADRTVGRLRYAWSGLLEDAWTDAEGQRIAEAGDTLAALLAGLRSTRGREEN